LGRLATPWAIETFMSDYTRNVPPVRRTTRTHGERKQDREARRNHEFEAAKVAFTPGAPIELPIACPCSFRPYPHIIRDEWVNDRHRDGKPH
jgi:hypothetical protein